MDSNNDFEGISIPYQLDTMVDIINRISCKPEEYTDALHDIQHHQYLNMKTQIEKYIGLIEK